MLIAVSSCAESLKETHDEQSIDAEQNITACPLLEKSSVLSNCSELVTDPELACDDVIHRKSILVLELNSKLSTSKDRIAMLEKSFEQRPTVEETETIKNVPNAVGFYTDCFEIFCQRPIKIKDQFDWSHTTRNCIVYFKGIWRALYSDKFIVEDSGFLENLIYGDLVVVDRGFTVHEAVVLQNETLAILSFLGKQHSCQTKKRILEDLQG
ncbi:hypothetical protein DAPPUDRAFT_320369 [Daphnia pulex]|uniref:DDE Tnp4 domain-containing protein n=1 Tax=Daphnia pulex TaxID=6669 RepID=E9GPN6_DAPPU|nr:hypothetical protein DAPPUDRAFT_320369 [Daphnia pulex]|eukprot:EFX78413.1 hypothetical protein DAPPUDRAFT_320369 [Daphnia pulex]